MDEITHLLDHSNKVADYRLPDQELLIDMFRGRWQPLPWWCNAFKTARAVHQDIWSDDQVRLIHYTWV